MKIRRSFMASAYTKWGISVHYFCLLFSSGLMQKGETDDDGILGFLKPDIMKEVTRAKRLRCLYCSQPGATIGCVVGKCRSIFHLHCGKNNNALNQYFGNFSSFCCDHRPVQKVPSSTISSCKGDEMAEDQQESVMCSICMAPVKAKPSYTTLRSPCCQRAWYHRQCMQNQANCAGLHFFKCPLCNNVDKFQREMLQHGIYIPDQDAAWELEPNAFHELLERHSHCDAHRCLCRRGRKYVAKRNEWALVLCDICGSQGTHVKCSNLKTIEDEWICADCKQIVGSAKKKTWKNKPLADTSNKAESQYPGPSGLQKRKRMSDAQDSHEVTKRRRLSSPSVQYVIPRQKAARRRWRLRQEQEDEFAGEDLENKPHWYRRLMNEDILTGANLGRKLSPVSLCQPGEEPPLPGPCQEALERLGSRQLQVRLQHLEVQPETPVKHYLHKLHHRQDTPLRNILQNSTPLQRLLSATNSPAHAKQRLDFSMAAPTACDRAVDSPSRTWLTSQGPMLESVPDATSQGLPHEWQESQSNWTSLKSPATSHHSPSPALWPSMNLGEAVPSQTAAGRQSPQPVPQLLQDSPCHQAVSESESAQPLLSPSEIQRVVNYFWSNVMGAPVELLSPPSSHCKYRPASISFDTIAEWMNNITLYLGSEYIPSSTPEKSSDEERLQYSHLLNLSTRLNEKTIIPFVSSHTDISALGHTQGTCLENIVHTDGEDVPPSMDAVVDSTRNCPEDTAISAPAHTHGTCIENIISTDGENVHPCIDVVVDRTRSCPEDTVWTGGYSVIDSAIIKSCSEDTRGSDDGISDARNIISEVIPPDALPEKKNGRIYMRRLEKSFTTKNGRTKKYDRVYNRMHPCPFGCSKLFSNYLQHVWRKHRQKALKELGEMEGKEQKHKLELLRCRAEHKWNICVLRAGYGEILIIRRGDIEKFDILEYGPCPDCFAWLKTCFLSRHICIARAQKTVLKSQGELALQSAVLAERIGEKPSDHLIKEVYTLMRLDEVSRLAQKDPLIIRLGNVWVQRNFSDAIIRKYSTLFVMRLMAKVLIKLHEIKPLPEGRSFWDYLKPQHYDAICWAALSCCHADEENPEHESPNNAIKLGFYLKQIICIKQGESITNRNKDAQEEAADLLSLMKNSWSSKLKKLSSILHNDRQLMNVIVPAAGYVVTLAEHLKMELCAVDLDTIESFAQYKRILLIVLARLITYNKSSLGEVQALRLDHYYNSKEGLNEFGDVPVSSFTPLEKMLINSHEVVYIHRKCGKCVPLLIPHEVVRPMEFLGNRDIRNQVGVPKGSPYMFANQNCGVVRGYHAVSFASEQAGLTAPASWFTTSLSKYIATVTQILDVEEDVLQQVLRHIGYTYTWDNHKPQFHQISDINERLDIAKLLLMQDAELIAANRMKRLDEFKLRDVTFTEILTNDVTPSITATVETPGNDGLEEVYYPIESEDEEWEVAEKPTRRREKKDHAKRHRWSVEETNELKVLFKSHFQTKQCPRVKDLKRAIEASKENYKKDGTGYIWKQKRENIKKKVNTMTHYSKMQR